MSSTSVRSQTNNEIEIVSGEFHVNSRDKKIDMPPSSAKRFSPFMGDENILVIDVLDGTINDKGILIGSNNQVVAEFNKKEVTSMFKSKVKKSEKINKDKDKEESVRD